jgi:hypothetical protein
MTRSVRIARTLIAAPEPDSIDFWAEILHAVGGNFNANSIGDALEERSGEPISRRVLERLNRFSAVVWYISQTYPGADTGGALIRRVQKGSDLTREELRHFGFPDNRHAYSYVNKTGGRILEEVGHAVENSLRHLTRRQVGELPPGQVFYLDQPGVVWTVVRQRPRDGRTEVRMIRPEPGQLGTLRMWELVYPLTGAEGQQPRSRGFFSRWRSGRTQH